MHLSGFCYVFIVICCCSHSCKAIKCDVAAEIPDFPAVT